MRCLLLTTSLHDFDVGTNIVLRGAYPPFRSLTKIHVSSRFQNPQKIKKSEKIFFEFHLSVTHPKHFLIVLLVNGSGRPQIFDSRRFLRKDDSTLGSALSGASRAVP